MAADGLTLVTVLPPSQAPGAVPAGPVGRHLARRLLARGGRARVLAPGPELAGWPAGTELIEGSVTDPAVNPDAFRGIDHLCVTGLVALVPERLRDLANLAIRGGVSRVAILASHGSDFEDEYSPETWQWLAFEQALAKNGAAWTYVRPTALFASAVAGGYPPTGCQWASLIRRGEPVREYLPDVAYPFTHEDDVAAVLAGVLLAGGRDGQVLDISGDMISAAGRLRLIGERLGREVRLTELPTAEAARDRWRGQGWPDVTIDVTLYAMQAFAESPAAVAAIRRQEELAAVLLGRPPLTFADWLTGNLSAFL